MSFTYQIKLKTYFDFQIEASEGHKQYKYSMFHLNCCFQYFFNNITYLKAYD